LRGRAAGQAAAKVATAEITPQALQNTRNIAAIANNAAEVTPPPSSRYIPSAPWYS
jgi:hypothetical protein